jgi:hypothetical protein
MPGGVPQDATGDSTKGLRPRQRSTASVSFFDNLDG